MPLPNVTVDITGYVKFCCTSLLDSVLNNGRIFFNNASTTVFDNTRYIALGTFAALENLKHFRIELIVLFLKLIKVRLHTSLSETYIIATFLPATRGALLNENINIIFRMAILRVLSNSAVLALLKNIWLLFKLQSNNEVLRDLIILVISP
jgi:hypothetical protein